MTFQLQNITLAKLVPSKLNVRRTGTTERVDELAASISAHGLLQNLTVKPTAKGKFEVVAGGRRLAALKLLAKRKAWDEPVPCQVMEGDNITEISLAENALQAPMHPADQYEAFAKLHDAGMSSEDIAARFGVTPHVVAQRLKLGAVSSKLMALYREGEMNLEQLSAFAITDDHERQEQVWDQLHLDRSRHAILEALGEGHVSTDDRRARFVGMEVYQAAGGQVLRDLFDEEGGGFLTDAALLNRLVRERLEAVAEGLRTEGWKWVQVEPEFDYALVAEMRRIYPEPQELTEDEQRQIEELERRYAELSEGSEEGDVDADQEVDRIDAEIERIQGTESFGSDIMARAGVFVSVGRDGAARIERAYVRREDDGDESEEPGGQTADAAPGSKARPAIPDSLMEELSAHRSAALARELAQRPELALLAITHAMALNLLYRGGNEGCLDISARRPYLARYAGGIETSIAGQAIEERHAAWQNELPRDPGDLWDFLMGLAPERQMSLLAHCASLTIDAVTNSKMRDKLGAQRHTTQLAAAVALDMTKYWRPDAGYFGRLTKPQILAAVREATSPDLAQSCEALKKSEMAARAAKLVEPTGWLPEQLR